MIAWRSELIQAPCTLLCVTPLYATPPNSTQPNEKNDDYDGRDLEKSLPYSLDY